MKMWSSRNSHKLLVKYKYKLPVKCKLGNDLGKKLSSKNKT